jgi:tetratricopeptide (TPR) repeat protein
MSSTTSATRDREGLITATPAAIAELTRLIEKERPESDLVRLKQAQDAERAAEAFAAERAQIEQQARDRIRMFEEVLELDPDDVLATYGLGMAHLQLEEYERAAPHLERATGLKKDHSAAFLSLGKCHEFLK